ncbi:MAG: primosomal protein N', partial [Pseudoxanthomonas suwonensis]|nr:primosomal protein N' [Pseudoxanthomonas suwonensis]
MPPVSPTTWKIALPLPLPQLFDYLPVPGAPARAGARVRVPLGKRELVGVLIAQGVAGTDAAALKPALALLDQEPLLEGELLQSLQWLARYLHAPLGEVLATALPAALRRGEPVADIREHGWRLTEAGATALQGMREGRPRTLAQRLRSGPLADADLHGEARAALRSLLKRELVAACTLEPDDGAAAMDSGPSPNPEQAEAIASVLAEATHFAPSLLEGVTGSGKTEVYLRLIADCLARGRQALVLVPEIGLTPQMLARFRRRLGVPVHALHSGLNDGERARVWELARRGRARVVVGTRSAVFTPLPDAGLIVVDEEHDGSYKQLDGIRYHARDFAIVRARALEVPVVLGSATPSLESLHNAQAGRYAHLSLRRRAGDAQPPRVRVLDVRKRALHGGLSEEALAAIGQVLEQGGQVLVFRNRRGYAPVLLC